MRSQPWCERWESRPYPMCLLAALHSRETPGPPGHRSQYRLVGERGGLGQHCGSPLGGHCQPWRCFCLRWDLGPCSDVEKMQPPQSLDVRPASCPSPVCSSGLACSESRGCCCLHRSCAFPGPLLTSPFSISESCVALKFTVVPGMVLHTRLN